MERGYGTDTSCGLAGYRSGVLVRGRLLLIEAAFRRLTTPRGTLASTDEEAAYGFDLSEYLGAVDAELAELSLPARVSAELLKDDRLTAVEVEVRKEETEGIGSGLWIYFLDIKMTPADLSGRFAFTLRIDQVTAELILGAELQSQVPTQLQEALAAPATGSLS
jgi:hypothetical protein